MFLEYHVTGRGGMNRMNGRGMPGGLGDLTTSAQDIGASSAGNIICARKERMIANVHQVI